MSIFCRFLFFSQIRTRMADRLSWQIDSTTRLTCSRTCENLEEIKTKSEQKFLVVWLRSLQIRCQVLLPIISPQSIERARFLAFVGVIKRRRRKKNVSGDFSRLTSNFGTNFYSPKKFRKCTHLCIDCQSWKTGFRQVLSCVCMWRTTYEWALLSSKHYFSSLVKFCSMPASFSGRRKKTYRGLR